MLTSMSTLHDLDLHIDARQRGVEPLREVRSRLVVDGSIFDIFYHG